MHSGYMLRMMSVGSVMIGSKLGTTAGEGDCSSLAIISILSSPGFISYGENVASSLLLDYLTSMPPCAIEFEVDFQNLNEVCGLPGTC